MINNLNNNDYIEKSNALCWKEFGTATFMDQFALIDAIDANERTKA